jgi:hypothetical protein
MASAEIDGPLILAAFFLLLAKAEANILLTVSLWWAFFWVSPLAYLCMWGLVANDLPAWRRRLTLLPLLVFAVLLFTEARPVGTQSSRWWMPHGLMCLAILLPACGMTFRSGAVKLRMKFAVLILATLAVPVIPVTNAERLWRDCWRLRVGNTMAEVFSVLHDQYLLTEDKNYPIRELSPTDWAKYEGLMAGSADFNADVVYLDFQDGRLTSYRMSPD